MKRKIILTLAFGLLTLNQLIAINLNPIKRVCEPIAQGTIKYGKIVLGYTAGYVGLKAGLGSVDRTINGYSTPSQFWSSMRYANFDYASGYRYGDLPYSVHLTNPYEVGVANPFIGYLISGASFRLAYVLTSPHFKHLIQRIR